MFLQFQDQSFILLYYLFGPMMKLHSHFLLSCTNNVSSKISTFFKVNEELKDTFEAVQEKTF